MVTAAIRPVGIGLLGCGTVGSAVSRLLTDRADAVARATDREVEVVAVAVRDLSKPRRAPTPRDRFTNRPFEVVEDPDVDVVVEAIGGISPARELAVSALESGRPVITANKALVGSFGRELEDLASLSGAPLRFEAAVAGAVPAIHLVRTHLAADRVLRIDAVLNGTTNHLLCLMAETGAGFDEALGECRRRGFAEADSERDLNGTDAADKLAVLARLALGLDVRTADVDTQGIEGLSMDDVRRAAGRGRVWRLVCSASAEGELRVAPRELSSEHPLARLRGPENGLLVEAERAGRLFLAGPGAGGDASAAAIVADVVEVVRASARLDGWAARSLPRPAEPARTAGRRAG